MSDFGAGDVVRPRDTSKSEKHSQKKASRISIGGTLGHAYRTEEAMSLEPRQKPRKAKKTAPEFSRGNPGASGEQLHSTQQPSYNRAAHGQGGNAR